MRPTTLIDACVAGHQRMTATVDRLRDDEFMQPSLLPNWSRSDVVAWLAVKAKSHVHLFDGAVVGEVRHQFPDGFDQADALRTETSRGATHLRRTLTEGLNELRRAWSRLPDDLWTSEAVTTAGARPLSEVVARHLRDVEVHHVDLDVGYGPSSWPAEFVDHELVKRLRDLGNRADRAALLAWLLDRAPAPELGPW